MATKIKPMFSRKVGMVPFKSFITHDDKKGKYMVTTKFNGKSYVGTGSTERLATLDLNQTMGKEAKSDKLVQTEYLGE